jgi:thiol-disulfide isomerase/thioredoxin
LASSAPHAGRLTPAAPGLALAGLLIASACSRSPGEATHAPAPTPITLAQLRERTASPTPKVVLVNVWATWCGPCREELPALVKLQRETAGQGIDIVLVSADTDVPMEKMVEFLTSNGVTFQTYLKTEGDTEFMKGLTPDWSGAIPATFVYEKGELVDFWEGKATYDTFAAKVTAATTPDGAPPAATSP